MQHYLVEIDSDNEFFRKFRRFFKQYNTGDCIENYAYAGFVENGGYVVSDDEDAHPEAEIIDLNEWATRFPGEGILTSLPENYLVETDTNSPLWKEFRHFSVEQGDDDFCAGDYSHVGMINGSWNYTDDQYDYPECDVLTLEEWKQLCKPQFEAW